MSVLSVPLNPELEKMIERMVKNGVAANKAEVARKAIEFFAEEQAVLAVLKAKQEPSLEGDLDELANMI